MLLFGIRWLRKAMLRSAGVIDLRDEASTYQKEILALGANSAHLPSNSPTRWDAIAIVAAFKAVTLEGHQSGHAIRRIWQAPRNRGREHMNILGRTMRGLFGLFIDDGKLALTIVGVLLVTGLLTRLDSFDRSLAMVLLVAGSIGALLANVVHAASATKR